MKLALLLLAAVLAAEPLPIGSAAPPFSLPGVDGKSYSLWDFKESPVLVVVFTAVHCPTAEVYEQRLQALVDDYRARGVAFVVIQPNSPKALRLDEMGYTDVGDTLDDMKVRAAHRRFNFPFLYDGDIQEVSNAYGPVATPHIFVFDHARKLRYQGRIDDSPREALVKVRDARLALDAVLAGKPVPLEKTPAVGCSIKWAAKAAPEKVEPVNLSPVTTDQLKALARGTPGKTTLIAFWATWCGPCTAEFPELQKTWRMYRKRPFDMVTVAINYPDEEKGVRRFLDSQNASTRNHVFGAMEIYDLIKAFDPNWGGAVPYTLLLGPDGRILLRETGTIDMLEFRRAILASFPDDDYIGQNAYWNRR